MQKKRSFCATICPCFFTAEDDTENRPQQAQGIDLPQPPALSVAAPKKELLGVHREFELNLSQISAREERVTQDDINMYKYNCPICLLFFNKILKTKCCDNYVCLECESDIHEQILAKKIENKCWWCKSDKCAIVNVDDTEVIKNYSDAAVAQEEEEKKKNHNDSKQQQQQLELIRSVLSQKLSMRKSLAHSKNFQNKSNFLVNTLNNNNNNNMAMNPLMINTIKSEQVEPFGRRTFQNNKNNNSEHEEEEEERKDQHADQQEKNYIKNFAKTDGAAMMRAQMNVQKNQQIDEEDVGQGYNQPMSKSLVENNTNNNAQSKQKLHSSICVLDQKGSYVPIGKALESKKSMDNQIKDNSNIFNNNMYGNKIRQNDYEEEEEEHKMIGGNQQQQEGEGYFFSNNNQNSIKNNTGTNNNYKHSYKVSEIREQEEVSQLTFPHIEASQMNNHNNNFPSQVSHLQSKVNNNNNMGGGHAMEGSICSSEDINDRV